MTPESAAAAKAVVGARSRRRFKNFLLKPKHQVSYGYHMVVASLVFFGTSAALIWRKMGEIHALLAQSPETPIPYDHLTALFSDVTETAMIGFFAYALFTSVFALIFSHRVAGPMTAIIAYIEQLQQGNFEYRRELRRRDELQPILDELKRLASSLREREG